MLSLTAELLALYLQKYSTFFRAIGVNWYDSIVTHCPSTNRSAAPGNLGVRCAFPYTSIYPLLHYLARF